MRANGPLEVCGSHRGGWQTYKVSRRQAEQQACMSRKGGSPSVHCYTTTPATPDSREILGGKSRGIPGSGGIGQCASEGWYYSSGPWHKHSINPALCGDFVSGSDPVPLNSVFPSTHAHRNSPTLDLLQLCDISPNLGYPACTPQPQGN